MVWTLSSAQTQFEERVRTIGISITALGVVALALKYLRPALLPFVLAIALQHLLEPVIHILSVRPIKCCGRSLLDEPMACRARHDRPRSRRLQTFLDYACRLQLNRTLAVFVALLLAFLMLGLLAAIVAESVKVFADHADLYAHQLRVIIRRVLGWIEYFSCSWTPRGCNSTSTDVGGNSTDAGPGSELESLLAHIPLSELVLQTVEAFLELCSNLFVVLLFTVYLLLSRTPHANAEPNEVDAQILAYIKGKVALSTIIGVATALVLLGVGLDLWLVFGVLAFWLNFVPNVGAVIAVLLPMPLLVLDPDTSTAAVILAFVLPFVVHMFVGNVLEPLLFGHSLELHPIAILLSLMVWGMLWGIIGMVLAVPMTAVLKIHLASVDHPAAAFIVRMLAGHEGDHEDGTSRGEGGRGAVPSVEEGVTMPLRAAGSQLAISSIQETR